MFPCQDTYGLARTHMAWPGNKKWPGQGMQGYKTDTGAWCGPGQDMPGYYTFPSRGLVFPDQATMKTRSGEGMGAAQLAGVS